MIIMGSYPSVFFLKSLHQGNVLDNVSEHDGCELAGSHGLKIMVGGE